MRKVRLFSTSAQRPIPNVSLLIWPLALWTWMDKLVIYYAEWVRADDFSKDRRFGHHSADFFIPAYENFYYCIMDDFLFV
jgi:hypothetical protein